MPDRESFTGTSGLLDDADIIVRESQFGYFSDYNEAKNFVNRLGVTNLATGEESDLFLSCGTGWEDKDGGSRAVREDTGQPNVKGFNRSCRYYQFTAGLVAVMGDADADAFMDRGETYEAKLWPGVKMHVDQVKGKNPVTGEERDVLMPTAFLGFDGVPAQSTPAPAPVVPAETVPPTPAAATPAPTPASPDTASIPPQVAGVLRRLAKEAGSHDAFVEAAFTEIADAENYQAIILDDSEAGFYAENHA